MRERAGLHQKLASLAGKLARAETGIPQPLKEADVTKGSGQPSNPSLAAREGG